MKAQAEISIYPLRQNDLTKPIRQFVQALENNKLKVKFGPMSSFITGDSQMLFQALQKAFEQAAENYDLVLTVKMSNACPEIKWQ